MVRDRPARGERRLEMHYAADRRCVCRTKMNPRPIISFHAVGGTLDPPSAPPLLSTFMDGNLSPVRRPMRITAGLGVDRSTWNPIWTQETRLRTRVRRLRREAPENSFRRRGGQAGPRRYGISRAADHDQRADEGWPTGPSDGPRRSMLVRLSPVRGRCPPDRPRISIVHPYPRGGFRLLMRTPRR
jgi:hypothetical protein